MSRIFLNFRKADERLIRDRFHRALEERFGAAQVFKSGTTIPPGSDYDAVLRRQAADCEIMLALIGPQWAGGQGLAGRSLDRPEDWVRVEIATALDAGNTVVPVLIGEATMLPDEKSLPGDIAKLATLQFRRIRHSSADTDIAEIIDDLVRLQPTLEGKPPMPQNPAGRDASRNAQNVSARRTGNVVQSSGSGNTTAGRDVRSTTHNKKGVPPVFILLAVIVIALVIYGIARLVPVLTKAAQSSGLSATSTCQQFLDADSGTEQQAMVDIADANGETGFGSPLALPEIRYECSGDPSLALGTLLKRDSNEFN